jgi:hypothetical protein
MARRAIALVFALALTIGSAFSLVYLLFYAAGFKVWMPVMSGVMLFIGLYWIWADYLKGKSHRPGLFQCNECREHFTVTVGSVMERSHIPLHKWVLRFHLMNASKKGMSAHQLHRMLNITYKSAWFMAASHSRGNGWQARRPDGRSAPAGAGR